MSWYGTRRALVATSGVAGGGGISPTFLLRDDFTTDEAAPLASPRTTEPGGETLTLVQMDGEFSISGGELAFPAQSTPVHGDQRFYYGSGYSRLAGRAVLFSITPSTVVHSERCYVGWAADTTGSGASLGNGHFVGFNNEGTALVKLLGTNTPDVFSVSTAYHVAVIFRSTGVFWLIKGGAYTDWTLMWVLDTVSTATMYPMLTNHSAAGTLDTFRVADLGGPWATDYGIATDRLAGSVSAGATFTHEADFVGEFTVDNIGSSGDNAFRFRAQDSINYWVVLTNPAGQLSLWEVVANSATQRGFAAGVVANGDRIVVVADDDTIRVYEANTLRITYSSAANFKTETDGSLATLATGGAVSDVTTWPRTISGVAKSWLDAAVA